MLDSAKDSGLAAPDSMLDKCNTMLDGCNCEGTEWMQELHSTYQNWSCTARLIFKSMDIKHILNFLKHVKHLNEVGVRFDDDLTRLQQKQRQDISVDFCRL